MSVQAKTDERIFMKLVDANGNEVTSKENKEAKELEKQLTMKTEKIVEPIFNKLKLANQQVSQEQLMQLTSMAHQILFNRMVYNIAKKLGIEKIEDIVSDDDVEELKTAFGNQFRFGDPSEADSEQ